jgi:hypothetical protein
MQLKTYPRLNLPTKRLGIDADDWLWVAAAIMPGMVTKSMILFTVLPTVVYVWASQWKAKKPRGWLSTVYEYLLSPKTFMASLERKDASHLPRH